MGDSNSKELNDRVGRMENDLSFLRQQSVPEQRPASENNDIKELVMEFRRANDRDERIKKLEDEISELRTSRAVAIRRTGSDDDDLKELVRMTCESVSAMCIIMTETIGGYQGQRSRMPRVSGSAFGQRRMLALKSFDADNDDDSDDSEYVKVPKKLLRQLKLKDI